MNQRPLRPEHESDEDEALVKTELPIGIDTACTKVRTGEAEKGHKSTVEAFAAAMRELSPDEQAKLMALLKDHTSKTADDSE